MRRTMQYRMHDDCASDDCARRFNVGSPAWAVAYTESLPDMLTPRQVAETLNISARTARELCASGSLEGAFKLGSTWRIPRGAIAQLIAGGGIHCGSIRDLQRNSGRN